MRMKHQNQVNIKVFLTWKNTGRGRWNRFSTGNFYYINLYYIKPIIRSSTLINLWTPFSTSHSWIIISAGPQCNSSETDFFSYHIKKHQDIIIYSQHYTSYTYNFFVLKTLIRYGVLNLCSRVGGIYEKFSARQLGI